MKMKRLNLLLILTIALTISTLRAETTTYYVNDLVGSPIAAMDQNGTMLWRESYNPYGESRISPSQNSNDIGFTGHQKDNATGLTYMQARYYDPVVGRFYGVDPIGFRDIHSFNRYAYANNNPYKFTDPDGRCSQAADAHANVACQDSSTLSSSDRASDLIKTSEAAGGAVLTIYEDGDNAAAGYGHNDQGNDGFVIGETITLTQAEDFLTQDISSAEQVVQNLVGDLQLSQNEFDGLVDLAFNVGPVELNSTNSPGLNNAITAGNYTGISNQLKYTKVGNDTVSGLETRSASRKTLFTRDD